MRRYLATRLGLSFVTLIGISIIVFSLARISGDVVGTLLPPEVSTDKAHYDELKKSLGLDKSYPEQYVAWVGNLVQGDFGESIRYRQDTWPLFKDRFPNTLKLALVAGTFAILFGISIGALTAIKRGSPIAAVGNLLALLGQAVPSFFIGILFILFFSVKLGWLPTSGMGDWRTYIMPAVTMSWFSTAALVRMTRSSMLDVLDRDHVKLARLNGLPERWIIWRHALRNALIPILTLFSLQFLVFISGSVIVETIFAWPGIGQLSIEAIRARDYPMIQTILLITSALVLATNLAVDLLYAVIDPRIRLGG